MSVETPRIVRLAAPAGGTAAGYSLGSGFVIAPELVLTAAHVLRRPDVDGHVAHPGEACEVLLANVANAIWQVGEVAASDPTSDLAVVRVPGLMLDVAPIPWGRLDDSLEPIRWFSGGFPTAARDVDRSNLEVAWGEFSPAAAMPAGYLELTVASREARDTPQGNSGWGGLSGGAMFCHDHLVGVVIHDQRAFYKSLRAVRVERLLDCPAVHAAAGNPEFAEISTQGVRYDTDSPIGRWASMVAGYLDVRPPHYADAGEALEIDTARWPADWVKMKIASRLLAMPLQHATEPVCDLLTGMRSHNDRRGMINAIIPLWVSPRAAEHFHALIEQDVHVLLANVAEEMSVREFLRRAWHCDRRKFRVIGTTGVAGEEQIDTFLEEVRDGLYSEWASDDPADDDGIPVFVLLQPSGQPQLAVAAVDQHWPSLRTIVYTDDDPQTIVAAIPHAQVIQPLTPGDERVARGHRKKLNSSIEEVTSDA